MSTIIIGDVAAGAVWWSQAHFYKLELARMYKQNNAFMQAWKFPAADVKIHVIMRAGKPWAFIYVEGKVQVCWQNGLPGSEFIYPTGQKIREKYYGSSGGHQGTYWVNKNLTDGISSDYFHIFYKGVRYEQDSAMQNQDIKNLTAMRYKGVLLLLYRIFNQTPPYEIDYFIAKGVLTPNSVSTNPGSLSSPDTPVNISANDNGIIFAAFGGDDLLWTISYGGTNSEATFQLNTELYVRCYKISNGAESGAEFLPVITLVAEKQYESKEELIPNLTILSKTPDPYTVLIAPHREGEDIPYLGLSQFWSGSEVVAGFDNHTLYTFNGSRTNKIQDIFIQGDSISIAFRDSSVISSLEQQENNPGYISEDRLEGEYIIDGPELFREVLYEEGGNPGHVGLHILTDYTLADSDTLRVDVLTLTTTNTGYDLITATVFSETVPETFHTIYDSTRIQADGITTKTWYYTGPYDNAHEVNYTQTTVITQESVPFSAYSRPYSITTNLNWQYADGINQVYIIDKTTSERLAAVNEAPTVLTRWATVKGRYGDYESPKDIINGVYSAFTHDPTFVQPLSPATRNSNTPELISNQGLLGAFDTQTYLVQRFHYDPPYWTDFAFAFDTNKLPIKLIEQSSDFRALTIGAQPNQSF